jgi:hypothetical protein
MMRTIRKRDRVAIVAVVAAALVGIAAVGSAAPQPPVLAFDFDTDQDPTTIQNEVQAAPGDLVQAFLVINDFPLPWEFLGGAEFGLEFDSGLRLEGVLPGTEQGAVMNDGHRGIVVAWGMPYTRHNLPAFAASFVFSVLSEETQTVRVVPSTGWGTTSTGFTFAVRSQQTSGWVEVESPAVLASQLAGIVRSGQLPTVDTTWGSIKDLYTADVP